VGVIGRLSSLLEPELALDRLAAASCPRIGHLPDQAGSLLPPGSGRRCCCCPSLLTSWHADRSITAELVLLLLIALFSLSAKKIEKKKIAFRHGFLLR
jgi:hypothetical protein